MSNEISKISEIEILENKINIYGTIDEPLFRAKEIADFLGFDSASRVTRLIDEDKKLTATMWSFGQERQQTMLTYKGLCEVFLKSRKPNAQNFVDIVTEHLDNLRKYGVTTNSMVNIGKDNNISSFDYVKQMRFLISQLTNACDRVETLSIENEKLNEKIEEDKPKVELRDEFIGCDTDMSLEMAFKSIKNNLNMNIKLRDMYKICKEAGFIFKRSNRDNYLPKENIKTTGWFVIKDVFVEDRTYKSIVVTNLGFEGLVNFFKDYAHRSFGLVTYENTI